MVVGSIINGKLIGYNDALVPVPKLRIYYKNKFMQSPAMKSNGNLLQQIKDAMNNFTPGSAWQKENAEIRGKEVEKSFRSLGVWENDYSDEQNEYEDNDQRVWASGEHKKYLKFFTDWAKKYPWFKKVNLGLQTSEKDWCYFKISLK